MILDVEQIERGVLQLECECGVRVADAAVAQTYAAMLGYGAVWRILLRGESGTSVAAARRVIGALWRAQRL